MMDVENILKNNQLTQSFFLGLLLFKMVILKD